MDKKKKKYNYLEEKIEYQFKNKSLIENALIHSSYSNELVRKKIEDNERLEFLGDAVLELVISEFLYKKFNEFDEGELSKIRANLVCEKTLSKISREIKLGEFLRLGKGESRNGGRERDSILANALEALFGAVYLDGGLKESQRVIKLLYSYVEIKKEDIFQVEYKGQVQEWAQRKGKEKVEYKIIKEWGPEHNKNFEVVLVVDGKVISKGKGKNKKRAEQEAAKNARISLDIDVGDDMFVFEKNRNKRF